VSEEAAPTPTRLEESPEPDHDQQLLRALADLDNLRKRFARELDRERQAERRRIAGEWLPVVDDLERALEHAAPESSEMHAGIAAIYEQALAVLARLGFERFEDVGAPFDPRRHEAVGAIPSEAPRETVVTATRSGFGNDEEVLRPAAVIVSTGNG
jgi:molecular chaperone GrpE